MPATARPASDHARGLQAAARVAVAHLHRADAHRQWPSRARPCAQTGVAADPGSWPAPSPTRPTALPRALAHAARLVAIAPRTPPRCSEHARPRAHAPSSSTSPPTSARCVPVWTASPQPRQTALTCLRRRPYANRKTPPCHPCTQRYQKAENVSSTFLCWYRKATGSPNAYIVWHRNKLKSLIVKQL